MLTITILDRYLPAYPPTIHQMQMLMYISALRIIKVASWVLLGFRQHVIVQEDTDHLSMNIWGMMLQLRLYVIYCIYIYIDNRHDIIGILLTLTGDILKKFQIKDNRTRNWT